MNNKKLLISIVVVIIVALIGGIVVFRNNTEKSNTNNENETTSVSPITTEDKNILVAYFSVPETEKTENLTQDEENSTVIVNGKTLGNTQYVANLISEKTGGELYRIEPVNAYPTNHDELLDRAMDEMRANDGLEIKDPLTNLNDYDIIFLGYPIWNADLPPIIHTFLDENNFDGKTVIPFSTHGGSGLADTVRTISETLTNADVISNGFTLSRSDMETAPDEVNSWLETIGIQ